MDVPEFTIVAGPNAAGKSSFIRSRISELEGCEIIMTDVYKNRTTTIFREALKQKKDIVLETVFNDASFKDLVDEAHNSGYRTSLIVLFLDTIQDSIDRVAFRSLQQSGLQISGSNIRINFNESFKNTARYYFYFDQAEFYYTGKTGSELIMRFQKSLLISYKSSDLQYPQKFADFAVHDGRLSPEIRQRIKANEDFGLESEHQQSKRPRMRFRL